MAFYWLLDFRNLDNKLLIIPVDLLVLIFKIKTKL